MQPLSQATPMWVLFEFFDSSTRSIPVLVTGRENLANSQLTWFRWCPATSSRMQIRHLLTWVSQDAAAQPHAKEVNIILTFSFLGNYFWNEGPGKAAPWTPRVLACRFILEHEHQTSQSSSPTAEPTKLFFWRIKCDWSPLGCLPNCDLSLSPIYSNQLIDLRSSRK